MSLVQPVTSEASGFRSIGARPGVDGSFGVDFESRRFGHSDISLTSQVYKAILDSNEKISDDIQSAHA